MITRFRPGRVTAAMLAAILCFVAWGCGGANAPVAEPQPPLRVAIFPFVPRPEQFQSAITAAWRTRHPEISLEFVFWNCYDTDPPASLDVFTFDGIFLDDFARRGLLLRLGDEAIDSPADFFPFVLRDARCDSSFFGWPQLTCANFVFTRAEDRALSRANDAAALEKVIGSYRDADTRPCPGQGLLLDFSDPGWTAVVYAAAWPAAPTAAFGESSPPDETATRLVAGLVRMAGRTQARYLTGEFDRATWFSRGSGRALLGFSEYLWGMDSPVRNTARLIPFCYAAGCDSLPVFTDFVCVNPRLPATRRALACELAGLMADGAVIHAALGADTPGGVPQYVMPARRSVFRALAAGDSQYARLQAIVAGDSSYVFKLGTHARAWLAANRSRMATMLEP